MTDLEKRLRDSLHEYAAQLDLPAAPERALSVPHRGLRVLTVVAATALVLVAVSVLWFEPDTSPPDSPVSTVLPPIEDPVIGLDHVGADPVPFPTGMASGFQGYWARTDDLASSTLTVHSSLGLEDELTIAWDSRLAQTIPDYTVGLDSRFATDPSWAPIGVHLGTAGSGTAPITITGDHLDDALTGTDKNARLAREEIVTLVNSLVFLDRGTAEAALGATPEAIRDTFELDDVTITRQIGLPSSSVQLDLGPDGRMNGGAALSILRDNLRHVAKQLLLLDDGRVVVSHSPLLQPAPDTGAVTVDDALLGLSWTLVDIDELRDTDGGRMLDVIDADGNPATITVVDYDTVD